MQIVEKLVTNIQIVAVSVILILLVFGGIGIYIFRFRKRVSVEKNVDYSNFNRKDVVEYIRIDDVTEDMLVSDGGKRFIAAVKCQGFSLRMQKWRRNCRRSGDISRFSMFWITARFSSGSLQET